MSILDTLAHGSFILVMVGLLALCYGIIFLWVVKAKYFFADKLFLRLDKELKKHGMWSLLMFMTAFVMSAFAIHGAIVFLDFLAHHA